MLGKYTIHKLFTLKILLFIIVSVFVVSADVANGAPTASFSNPISSSNFYCVLRKVANFVASFGIPVLVGMTVIAGFMLVAAQGNEKRLADAKRTIVTLVFATLIIMGAVIIAQIAYDIGTRISGTSSAPPSC